VARSSPDILFIGHGAERSGPPISLLLLQRWLAANSDWRFATVLGTGGELLDEMRALAPVRVVDDGWTPPRIAQQGLARVGRESTSRRIRAARDRVALRGAGRAGLVYVNTVSPETVRLALAVSGPRRLVVHVHELEAGLRYRVPPASLAALWDRADHVVAASDAVRDNLVGHHGLDPDRIVRHHEHVEPVEPFDRDTRTVRRVAHGLDPSAFLAIGSGRLEWRKGPDLFVQVAHRLRTQAPDLHVELVWVGGTTGGPDHWPLDHDIRHLGLTETVHFVGHQEDPAAWWPLADAFALTSREDAYPIACLEAASAGVPIVTFDSGGMVEFVGEDAGRCVPYPDLDGFAAALAGLARDPGQRRALGEQARRRAHEHAVDRSVPALFRRLTEWRG
jgi:glycosyltransferase involved in cell wall biosynthesis